MSSDQYANEMESESFAVFRNGIRVSDSIYPSEFYAQNELNYWKGIVSKWKDGSKVEVRRLRNKEGRNE